MSNLKERRPLALTVQDYVDSLYERTKSRSHANEEMWGHSASFSYAGVPYYNTIKGGCATGWHQQTSSLYQGGYWAYRKTRPKSGLNIGGPFHTRRVTLGYEGAYPHYHLRHDYAPGRVYQSYEGILFPSQQLWDIAKLIHQGGLDKHSVWTSHSALGLEDLRRRGEKIMLSVVPTTAPANAVVSVGELFSEGKFFSTPGKALLDQNPGGEFLNAQFGILPVISDAKSFKEAASSFNEVIRQYKRDSGKLIRRKAGPYTITDEQTVQTYSVTPAMVTGGVLSAYLARGNQLRVTKHTLRELWYSGMFEYMIPKGLSRLEELFFELNRAYGIAPDPADVWNLLPFSWLADWQTSSGEALQHLFLQTSEGATQTYGYVMCHTKVRTTFEWRGELKMDNAWQPHTITWFVDENIKQRARVIPFGTTFTGEELTARQLAILGALGISKS